MAAQEASNGLRSGIALETVVGHDRLDKGFGELKAADPRRIDGI